MANKELLWSKLAIPEKLRPTRTPPMRELNLLNAINLVKMGDRGFRGGGGRGRGGRGGPPRGGGRGRFQKANPDDPRVNSTVQVFVEGLPLDSKIPDLLQYFSSVGPVKVDRLTKKPRIWLYHDKVTNRPTGECTITYKDSETQVSALQTYDGQYFNGHPIRVTPSIVKSHMAKPPPKPEGGFRGRGRGGPPRGGRGGPPRGRGGFRGGRGGGSNYESLGGGPMRNRDERGFGRDRGHDGGFGRDRGQDRGYGGQDRGYGGQDRGYGGQDRGYGGQDRGYGGQDRGYGGQDRDYERRHDQGYDRQDRDYERRHDRGQDRGYGGNRYAPY